jgi:type IV secretion system protein VirD4
MKIFWVLLWVVIGGVVWIPALTALLAARHRLSPNRQQVVRAGNGAAMMAVAAYLALTTDYLFAPNFLALFWYLGGGYFWIAVAVWALLPLGGALALFSGVRNSTGERDLMETVGTIIQIAIGGGFLWWGAYVPQDWMPSSYDQIDYILKGVYLWVLVGGVAKLALSFRGIGGGLKEVKAQKAHGDISLGSEAEAKAAKLIGPSATEAMRLGRLGFDGKGGMLAYAGERHLLLIGSNGAGKATRVLIPDLLSLKDRSLVVIDPKGELAAVTADYRRTIGEVLIVNPFDVLGLGSVGFNPLAGLDPKAASFVDDAAGLGEALVKIEGNDPHWPESAQGLVVALLMWEVATARAGGRVPSLENVRALLTEPDEYEDVIGKDGKPRQKLVAGLRVTAGRMIATGGFEIESLASRFLRGTDEIASIQSTADTQTRWLLSPAVRADLAKDGVSFADLKKKPVTVYVILPAERMRTHAVWLRLVIVSALRSLYTAGGLPVLFMLDEFAQLGHLGPIEDAFGLVRGYGVQLWPILQDLNQLKELYKERWETFVANAGIVQSFAPNDLTTAEWMSRRAGETTVVAAAFNQGVGGGREGGEGMNYQQTKRPLFLPQELMDLPEGAGLIWRAGIAKAFPFMGEPYWKISEYQKRARPNPYYRGDPE